jgi:MarR family transcriptional regulator, 2-MHQ and catechol-resistance regulon repressor
MTTNVHLMVVLARLNQVFMDRLGKNLEELGMSPTIYPILAHLNAAGIAKTQKLGEVALITSGTITHLVNKLVKQGYVIKEQDDKDQRVFWVKITQHGRDAFAKVHEQHMVYLDALLCEFSDNEKRQMINQIKVFGKKLAQQTINQECRRE